MPACGTTNGYRKGCRCAECRRAHRDYMRAYVAKVKARDGLTPTEKIRGVATQVGCSNCGKAMHRPRTETPTCKACRQRAKRSIYIRPVDRLAIYERDGWVCGFCLKLVDRDARGEWAPSLDHITPRSLGGGDEWVNLRLVHSYCNRVRSNRSALTIDELTA